MSDGLLQRPGTDCRTAPARGVTPHLRAVPDQLQLRRGSDAHGAVLALRGELDLASAPRLELELSRLEATRPGRILIDLRELRFVDCAGISVIVGAQRSAEANGHRLALRRGPRQVQRLFMLTELLHRFTFED